MPSPNPAGESRAATVPPENAIADPPISRNVGRLALGGIEADVSKPILILQHVRSGNFFHFPDMRNYTFWAGTTQVKPNGQTECYQQQSFAIRPKAGEGVRVSTGGVMRGKAGDLAAQTSEEP